MTKMLNKHVNTTALRRRIRSFYMRFNRREWANCHAHLDPRLREAAKVDLQDYCQSLAEFHQHYGHIDIWFLRASVHAGASADARPFAYVYILWQDARKGMHLFRERWVKDQGRWYTRVVGLVAHERNEVTAST